MFRPPPICAFTLVAALAAGCGDVPRGSAYAPPQGPRPDELPALVSRDLPFKYPPSLYARKVQGNVVLRLFIDRDGRVVPDSTRIDGPSGYAELDSAALFGAHDLRFVPAKLRGDPIAATVLLPLYFRHPEAPPLSGDSVPILRKRG